MKQLQLGFCAARSSMHPMGGTAYLNVENAEEPFSGGVKFTAMPPTKRFCDMEQLSGGEKARVQPPVINTFPLSALPSG